jgi:hypothetical protein
VKSTQGQKPIHPCTIKSTTALKKLRAKHYATNLTIKNITNQENKWIPLPPTTTHVTADGSVDKKLTPPYTPNP